MKPRRRLATVACWIGLAALAAGCQTPATNVRRPSTKSDACAEQLHEACGQLLLYYSLNRKLPETLEALGRLDPLRPLALTCPVSGKPYVYRADGLSVPGRPGRLVLYDPLPCHAGMRWGIFVDGAPGGKRLVARVLLLPEDAVSDADPATPPAPQGDGAAG